MVDQTASSGKQGAAKQKLNESAQSAKSIGDQALATGRDIKDKATDLAGASANTLKEQASGLVDAAKDVASQATDKLKQSVDTQKSSGADFVGNLAETMRRAAREFDTDLPIAATYIRKAASQVEGVSDSIRTGDLTDIVSSAQTFARRQPTVFLGVAMLAGFGVVRFLKSSADQSGGASSRMHGSSQPGGRTRASQKGYRNEFAD